MADRINNRIEFKTESIINFQGKSITGEVARYGAWSLIAGFNPGVTAAGSNYRIDPNACTLPELRNFVMTEYMNRTKP